MKYRLLVKAFLFVNGCKRDIEATDAPWLTEGEKKKFTDKQLAKLNDQMAGIVEKQQEKLENQGCDFDKMLKLMPKEVPADVTTNLDPSE